MQKSENRYIQVKNYILDGISQRMWGTGERVPSENELVDLCHVSRMTARRALQELLIEGILIRIKGKGSFVAEEKQQSSLLQIRSIAADIRNQGFEHHAKLLFCQMIQADKDIIHALELPEQTTVAHSQLLHFQDDEPIQLEYRWVNSTIVPEYIQQDYSTMTPSEYLSAVAPVTEAEHQVEAIIGNSEIRNLLKLEENEAVLLLTRKTWCNAQLISFARLYHPGNQYKLGTKFRT